MGGDTEWGRRVSALPWSIVATTAYALAAVSLWVLLVAWGLGSVGH